MLSTSLSHAYELTRSIEAAVDQGDWLNASQLVDERSPLLMSLAPQQSDEALTVIREIQRIDAAIMQHANGARDSMSKSFNEAKQRVAAASFYHKTGQLR